MVSHALQDPTSEPEARNTHTHTHIKFTEEDEMKYLIIEHSSGNYFGFNLHESNERTSAISIVQEKKNLW